MITTAKNSEKRASTVSELTKSVDAIHWFLFHEQHLIEQFISSSKLSGVTQIRVGINCNEASTKKGKSWYNWLIPTLGQHFKLKLCFDNHTKSEIESDESNESKKSLSEVVECFVHYHGQYFDEIELHKDPRQRMNSSEKINNIFSDELVFAATWAKYLGKKVSLANVHLEDYEWVSKLTNCYIVEKVEVSGLNLNMDRSLQN